MTTYNKGIKRENLGFIEKYSCRQVMNRVLERKKGIRQVMNGVSERKEGIRTCANGVSGRKKGIRRSAPWVSGKFWRVNNIFDNSFSMKNS